MIDPVLVSMLGLVCLPESTFPLPPRWGFPLSCQNIWGLQCVKLVFKAHPMYGIPLPGLGSLHPRRWVFYLIKTAVDCMLYLLGTHCKK